MATTETRPAPADPDTSQGDGDAHQPVTIKTTSGPLTLERPSSAGPTNGSPPSCWAQVTRASAPEDPGAGLGRRFHSPLGSC